MNNQWTAQNQSDYDKTDGAAFEQAQIENISLIDNKKFDIGAILCALGFSSDTTKWVTFTRATDYIENFAIGGLVDLKSEHLKEILEALESEGSVAINWENETYITNF